MGRKRQKQIKLCQWHVKAIGKPGGPGRSSGRHVAGLCRWPRLSAKPVVCRRSDGTAIGKGHGVGRRLPWASFANGRDLPMVCRRQIIEFVDGCFLPTAVLSAKNDFAHGMSLHMAGPSAKYFCRWLRFAIGKGCVLFADGLFLSHRQTRQPSANKPISVVKSPVSVKKEYRYCCLLLPGRF